MIFNTRIAISLASIAAAGALVVGGTFAFFSDSETSNNNVFSAGTLDLVLCDSNENVSDCALQAEGPGDSVTASFGGLGMAPGDCTDDQTLTLRNNGSINGNHVDIAASNTNGNITPFLRINNLTYGGSPVVVTDSNSNTYPDLQDLAASGLTDLSGINAGSQKDLVIDICLDTSANNTAQGESNTLDLSVLLDQGTHI